MIHNFEARVTNLWQIYPAIALGKRNRCQQPVPCLQAPSAQPTLFFRFNSLLCLNVHLSCPMRTCCKQLCYVS